MPTSVPRFALRVGRELHQFTRNFVTVLSRDSKPCGALRGAPHGG
jgi:hypothetical protein